MNVVEFLEARIDEDEALARECILPENLVPYSDSRIPPVAPEQWGNLARNYLGGEMGEHCARHNPLRILAECESKRELLRDSVNWDGYTRNVTTLRALALPYSDHPDYKKEWLS